MHAVTSLDVKLQASTAAASASEKVLSFGHKNSAGSS